MQIQHSRVTVTTGLATNQTLLVIKNIECYTSRLLRFPSIPGNEGEKKLASVVYQAIAGTSTRLVAQKSTIPTHATRGRCPFSVQLVPRASLPLDAIHPWAYIDNPSTLSLQRSQPSLGAQVFSQTSLFPLPQKSHPILFNCSLQNS